MSTFSFSCGRQLARRVPRRRRDSQDRQLLAIRLNKT